MATNQAPSQDVQEMVAQADTGARSFGNARTNPLVCSSVLVTISIMVRIPVTIYFQFWRTERHGSAIYPPYFRDLFGFHCLSSDEEFSSRSYPSC